MVPNYHFDFLIFFSYHNIGMKFPPPLLVMINLCQRTCGAHKVRSPLSTEFFSYVCVINRTPDHILKGTKTLTTLTNSLLVDFSMTRFVYIWERRKYIFVFYNTCIILCVCFRDLNALLVIYFQNIKVLIPILLKIDFMFPNLTFFLTF
jgi:hypothetical protein